MKIKLLMLFFTVSFITSCDKKESGGICTMEYVSFGVKFKDSEGAVVDVEEYRSINIRTGKILSIDKNSEIIGGYLVASDSNMKDLSRKGDVILVSGKHPITKEVKRAEFKISSGDCHIEKISGPTAIIFD